MDKFNQYVLLLNLHCPFTETELKRQYKLNLLKYHPDKNIENQVVATEKTKDINEAYNYLRKFVQNSNEDTEERKSKADQSSFNNTDDDFVNSLGNEYWNIWNDFLYNYLESHWKMDEMSGDERETGDKHEKIYKLCSKFIQSISLDYDDITTKCKEFLGKIDRNATKTMIDIIYSYSSLAKFPVNVASEVKESLRTVAEDVHNIVVITPSLSDLIEDNVYVYEKDDERYYVPLWHHELVYNIPAENKELTVKCTPDLPENVTIDDENNIHVEVAWVASDIISSPTEEIVYNLARKPLTIMKQNIVLKKQQKIILSGCGISRIEPQDMYNNSTRSDVIFHISLS